MKVTIYINKKDAQYLYDNMKKGAENKVEYGSDHSVLQNLCVTIEWDDYIILKDRNLLIEF